MRTNIEIRTLGFGGEFAEKFSITWSHKGKSRSVKELAKHLRKIVVEEKKMTIPDEPPADVPKRRDMPILGDDWTDEVKKLDEKYFQNESKFRQDAEALRNELESKGEGSMFSSMQPFIQPGVHDLVGRRIDVLSSIDVLVGKETQLRWCQGLVSDVVDDGAPKVANGKVRDATVMVQWDGMADVSGWEDGGNQSQVLKRHLWNKDKEGAWRLDIGVVPCPAYDSDDNESDGEDSCDQNVDESDIDEIESDSDSNSDSDDE